MIKRKNIAQVVFGCLIFFAVWSCTDQSHEDFQLGIEEEFKLMLINRGDAATMFWKWYETEKGKEYLAYFNIPSRRIECYDFSENSLLDSFPVDTEGPNGLLMIDFFLDDDQVIQVGKFKMQQYHYADKSPGRWYYDSLNIWMNSNYQFLSPFYDSANGWVYASIGTGGQYVRLNVDNRTAQIASFDRPSGLERFKEVDGLPTVNDYIAPYFSIANGKVFFDFPYSSDLFYLPDFTSQDLQRRQVDIDEPYLDVYTSQRTGDIIDDVLFQLPWFGPTRWDPYQKQYYRIAVSGQTSSENTSRKGFLLIFDEHLEYKGLTEIPSAVKYNQFFVTTKGLLFKNRAQPAEDVVYFSYLNFVE